MTALLIAYVLGCATPIAVILVAGLFVEVSGNLTGHVSYDPEWERISMGTAAEGAQFHRESAR